MNHGNADFTSTPVTACVANGAPAVQQAQSRIQGQLNWRAHGPCLITGRQRPQEQMTPTKASTKRSSLLTIGSAAVIAVFAAGYIRTRSAAEAFAGQTTDHRPAQVSLAVFEPRTPGEVTDSIAVAVITAAATSPPKRTGTTKRPSRGVPPAKRVATVKRRPPTPVVATNPEPTTPTRAPVAPEPTATAPAPEPAPPAQPPRGQFRDGVYRGYGTSRHGDIEAEVEVSGGRISTTRISQCLTRYSCSWISQLPGEVVARQTARVDYVSGATQSSDAFIQAVTDALSKAQ